MTKVLIINIGYHSQSFEFSKEEINELISFLQNGNKVVILECYPADEWGKIMNSLKNSYIASANLLHLSSSYHQCGSGIHSVEAINYDFNPNYPASLFYCIEKSFLYNQPYLYHYLDFTKNGKLVFEEEINNCFSNFLKEYQVESTLFDSNDANSIHCKLMDILQHDTYFKPRKDIKIEFPTYPLYDKVLFCDKEGTIEGTSFFGVDAPSMQNVSALCQYLECDKNLLCGVTSGAHQDGFISNEFYEKVKMLYNGTIPNLITFDEGCHALTLKDTYLSLTDNLPLKYGYGQNSLYSKGKIVHDFLTYLETQKRIPKYLYALGDNPSIDLSMLIEIHKRNGLVGLISPFKTKDEMLQSIHQNLIVNCLHPTREELANYKLGKTTSLNHVEMEYLNDIETKIFSKYLATMQQIDEHWDWLKNCIYDDAYSFVRENVK